MAEENKVEEENPFDVLAKIIKPATSYEDAYKRVWTAMKSSTLPEEKVIKILLSACAMPALAAVNIQMEQVLRAHGLIQDQAPAPAQGDAPVGPPAEPPADAPVGPSADAPAPTGSEPAELPHRPNLHLLKFPNKGPVVN